MKKAILLSVIAAMILCGCGNGTGVKIKGVVTTAAPEPNAVNNLSATTLPQGTVAPLEDSVEITDASAQDVPSVSEEEEFTAGIPQGYKRYSSSDGWWGIEIPAEAEIEEGTDTSVKFKLGENAVTALVMNKVVKLENVEQAKAHYAELGEISVNDFTVIRDNGEYKGSSFEFYTASGVRGFVKYLTDGMKTASVVAINVTKQADHNEILGRIANSLVIFN